MEAQPSVFLSGPMFSVSEKAHQNMISHALEKAGFKTVVPHRDGIEAAQVLDLIANPSIATMLDPLIISRCTSWITRATACLDIYWASTRDVTVLNLDGRVPDEGSLIEASAAWFNGRPVILYQTSPIRMLGANNNPMIGVISNWSKKVSTIKGLVYEVEKTKIRLNDPHRNPVNPNKVVNVGRQIAGLLLNEFDFDVPMSVVSSIEPRFELYGMCKFVLRKIVDYSKAQDETIQHKILLDAIDALNNWITPQSDSGMEDALIIPLPC